MTHDEFAAKMLKAMGGHVPLGARESYGKLLTEKGTEFWLDYNWIKSQRFYNWCIQESAVDFHEGAQGMTVWVAEFGRVGHDN